MGKWRTDGKEYTLRKAKKGHRIIRDLSRVGRRRTKKQVRCPLCQTRGRRKQTRYTTAFQMWESKVIYSCPNEDCVMGAFKVRG